MPRSEQREKVLVVEDESTLRHVYSEMLGDLGLEVTCAENGREGLELFEQARPDLVMLDINMPLLNGLDVCRTLKADPENQLVPVMMVTAQCNNSDRIQAMEAGADDFISKPVDEVELITRVRSLLRIKRYADELERAETVLCSLARSIEGKDPYTEGHCERLSVYSVKLGQRLGLSEQEIEALRRAGVVHDVGKVAVPDAVLLKQARLSPEEFRVIHEHPVIGEKICAGMKSFRLVLPIIRHHHEKFDGSGYPDGLAGEEIPLLARVLQIVDVFDALVTERPYKQAHSVDEALRMMQEEVDKGWWDARIFREFVVLVREEGLLGDTRIAATGT